MIFIMGGRGFVGSAFVRLFERLGLRHEVIDRANYAQFSGSSCDVLINANGNSKKFLSSREPAADFDATVRTTCSSLHDFKFGKYVMCSSCDVYDDLSSPGHNAETVKIDTSKISRYGFHKLLAEDLVRYEARDHLVIRFGGFVGPGMKKNPVFDILGGGPLWLAPESRLQYMHTDTAADRVWRLVADGISGEVINLCGNGLVGLDEIMEHAGRRVGVNEGSPAVRYEINIGKALGYFDIPSSRQAVFDFLDGKALGRENV